ncbi:MAG: PfkB family carbohydrate kinase [Thermoguttaceae bacterium]|nr:PfkB family carbohydrate kinase [Thermoguttaceae bacterium]
MHILKDFSSTRLAELIERFPKIRIAVLGDFFLDKYLEVDPRLAETSLETGKIAHQVVRVRHSPGAAGTIVSNLSALGTGALYAIGLTGDDGEGYELRQGLAALRCSTEYLLYAPDRHTPTYLKPRDITDPTLAGEHNRYDTKNRTPTPEPIQQQILDALDALLPQIDALIIQDQVEEEDCGVVTGRVVAALTERAQQFPHVIFWADSRRRIRRFRSVIIKPNQFEAVGWEAPPPEAQVPLEQLAEAVTQLRQQISAPICATCGSRGMLVSDPQLTWVPAVRVEGPIDPTGAGDSATAGAVLALAAGASLPEAALVGNLVASITIQQLATTGVARPEQLPPRLALWQKQQAGSNKTEEK